jgi:MurNAc alpha-1-phosphate uridylyltransferase
MILAAGRGERMRPLSDVTPKPLLRAGGKSLIEHQLAALCAAGLREIVVNLSWKGEMLRAALGDGARYGVRIRYSEEGGEPLETGGGVAAALHLLGDGPFVVVSADVWSDYDFRACSERLESTDVAHFVLTPNPDFHPHGDFGLEGARVVDSEPRYTYANIGVFRREFFSDCPAGKFPLAPLMFRWVRAGRVSGEVHRGGWRNVGTPQQLAELDQALRR